MTIKKFLTGAALLLGAFAGITTLVEKIPSVFAQSAVGGGFLISVTIPPPANDPDDPPMTIDFGTLLTSNGGTGGGLIGNVAPLECFRGGASVGLLVGSWRLGGGGLNFRMQGPIYDHHGQTISMVTITGNSNLTGMGGTASFAGLTNKTGCESLNGVSAPWTGKPITAPDGTPNDIP